MAKSVVRRPFFYSLDKNGHTEKSANVGDVMDFRHLTKSLTEAGYIKKADGKDAARAEQT